MEGFGSKKSSGNQSRRSLDRQTVDELEKLFCAQVVKPSVTQIRTWSEELNADFEDIDQWFNAQWKGKIEYEYQRAQLKDDVGPDPMERSRKIQSFEAVIIEDVPATEFVNCDEIEIEDNNAEEDEDAFGGEIDVGEECYNWALTYINILLLVCHWINEKYDGVLF